MANTIRQNILVTGGRGFIGSKLLDIYDVLDYEYIDKDPGILDSKANLNPYFPWKPITNTLG